MPPLRSLTSVLAALALVIGVSPARAAASVAGSVVATSPVSAVWVEPAAGMGFLQNAVARAAHSVDISMYELADPVLEAELAARAHAGVRVEVLLDADYGGARHNAASFAFLRQHGVAVRWARASRIFHAKYVLVDASSAFIGSGNLVRADYSTTRDFWVRDPSTGDIGAMTATFNADFNHVGNAPRASAGLVWSPGSTPALVSLIDSSRHSLVLENEEMASGPIESALINAARRGVSVALAMTGSPSWTAPLERLVAGGVHVATLRSSQIYIHAKVICADCASSSPRVFVGSENFSRTSLDRNRELGVVSSNPQVARAVATQVWRDILRGRQYVGEYASDHHHDVSARAGHHVLRRLRASWTGGLLERSLAPGPRHLRPRRSSAQRPRERVAGPWSEECRRRRQSHVDVENRYEYWGGGGPREGLVWRRGRRAELHRQLRATRTLWTPTNVRSTVA